MSECSFHFLELVLWPSLSVGLSVKCENAVTLAGFYVNGIS